MWLISRFAEISAWAIFIYFGLLWLDRITTSKENR